MILKVIRIITTRTVFMYLISALIIWRILDYPVFKKNAIEQSMNRLPPAVNYFTDFALKKDHYDSFKLNRCIVYHQKIVDFFPFERAEAYSILGYLYDLNGEPQKAIKAYKACLNLNPNFFWPLYNLGVGAFKRGDYIKSVEYFQTAIERNVNVNMILLLRAKVFADIRLSDKDHATSYDFLGAINEGRENAYIFVMESLSRSGDYKKLLNVAFLGLKDAPIHQDIYYFYAGRAAFYLNQYEQAVFLLNLSIQKNPNNPEALMYLGRTVEALGRVDATPGLFKKAQQLQSTQGSLIEEHLKAGVRFF